MAPIDVAFRDYLRPNLLAEIMTKQAVVPAMPLWKVDRRQPTVSLKADSAAPHGEKVSIDATVVPAADAQGRSKAMDFRLFRNGVLIATTDGVLPLTNGAWRQSFQVPYSAGANQFTAYSFSDTGIKSADTTIVVHGEPSHPRQRRRIAIVVGIDQYQTAAWQLRFAVADAETVAEELKPVGDDKDVEYLPIVLIDECATKQNILASLQALSGPRPSAPIVCGGKSQQVPVLSPEDDVFVYFSGHGQAYEDRFYMIPQEVTNGDFSAFLSASISDKEITASLRDVDARHLFLIIDACDSGQLLGKQDAPVGPVEGIQGLRQLAFEKGAYVLTASQPLVPAKEPADLKHGLLTYALAVDGLHSGSADINHDGYITAMEMLEFTERRVQALQSTYLPSTNKSPIGFTSEIEKQPDTSIPQRPEVFYRSLGDPDFVISDRTNDSTFEFSRLVLTPGESMGDRTRRLIMEALSKQPIAARTGVEGQFDDLGRWYYGASFKTELAYAKSVKKIKTHQLDDLPMSSNEVPSLDDFAGAETPLRQLQAAERIRLDGQCEMLKTLKTKIAGTLWSSNMKGSGLDEYKRHTTSFFSQERIGWINAELGTLEYLQTQSLCKSTDHKCDAQSQEKDKAALTAILKKGADVVGVDGDIWLNLPGDVFKDAIDFQDRCASAEKY